MTATTDPALLPPLQYDREGISDETLRSLLTQLLRPRLIEEKMLKQLRQGVISKWFSGIGQEAISVGCTAALQEDEFIFTMHRNLGVFTSRNIPLERLFAQWQGKPSGYTNGRDRSFHFGAPEHHIVGMISHLGPQLALASGVAMWHKMKAEGKVSLAFTGDGGTSEGDFHEALNVASVWKLPVIFVIENNGYGLSTPVREQYACNSLADRGLGYGMRSLSIDGNNVLEVYQTISKLAAEIRETPEPILIEARTFRVRGHEEASGVKYVPKELIQAWQDRDPVERFIEFCTTAGGGLLSSGEVSDLRKSIKKEIEDALAIAAQAPVVEPKIEQELADRFAATPEVVSASGSSSTEMRFIDAITDGLRESMRRHDNLVLMGQDIAEYGGVFKITNGFVDEFGRDRVRNTPLCESAIVGIGLGYSIAGGKAMVEMQFGDFVSCGFNQIVNNLAKQHYRWGTHADVTVRMPIGGGVAAGPYHSQTMEAWFLNVPGLKIVYPSNPADAKGLLTAALADPNPVLYFEHKALYRSLSGEVPNGYYHTEIGKAALAREGEDLSIITYGMGVHWALRACDELGVSADVVDLRSLAPIDYDTVRQSVAKTSRALVLHEATLTGGPGGELAAWIGEHCFELLDAPVRRVASLDTPVPFNAELEKQFMGESRLGMAISELLAY
ncbi:MAG: dehydrogenase E1 component subunit alpha/beta [Bacteroidota bacterium]